MDPEVRALARQEFAKIWKDLQVALGAESSKTHVESPKIDAEELLKEPPKGGKPN
jgi:hypothetical protein